MNRFFIYAVIVTLVTSGGSWVRATSGDRTDRAGYRGSTWSSYTGGGGGTFGNGSGGGGHK